MTVGRVGGIEMRGEIRPPLSAKDGIYQFASKCRPDRMPSMYMAVLAVSWQSHCSCDTKHFAGDTRLH